MGLVFSDCCVVDSAKDLRVDNEGVSNMDTHAPNSLLDTNNKCRTNPSIYAKVPNSDDSHQSTDPSQLQSENTTEDISKQEQQSQSETISKPTQNGKKQPIYTISEIKTEPVSSPTNIPNNKAQAQWRIVVTEPLSPITKLQNSDKSYENDSHPYSQHKHKQQLLVNGYIRRYNITNTILLPKTVTDLIFYFYYFHFADFKSQQSILNDLSKKQKSVRLICGDTNERNFSQFIETILNSKLSEKMWNKFDTDLKGVIETDKFTQFLILPAILYKSTLFHRRKRDKNGNTKGVSKPNLDKKQIKSDIEHLAVWIMCHFGERQIDHSFHFTLTKSLYQKELAHFISEYIRIHCH